ncbi:response regulator transcription factor [Candidatus Borkfalkia ceftriaxoniphila]|uniref:Stage 0 sporulation protein A homolog n=1 Tax=Candidatus Borkfalkia ceftriaxoniphila TaxID=2508949 RepID=A0A4Q2KEM9_9FIRM|nr:response regulator transcription factor [Candidatus Borkfalkia ceftriaxoniphila]RXZ61651.1 response regulator transcription factor [Candidatus Borkfalkia ceftriaxoniphila]
MNKKVYLLEDDTSICELVQCALEMSGIELSAYNTVYEFWAALEKSAPSLALLDIMLPDGNGLEVLAKIKQKYPQVSCIMLSALGQETDKVRGLNLGADDYIAKPFGILELTARVNAALRRHGESAGIVRGDLALDEETMTATLRGVKLELNNKEFNLLKYLMQKEGKALSRENILNAVWGYDEGETRTVDNHVARLRKLGIDYIETVFGVGYKFVYRE